ncbi:hypothetical protein HPHPH4_1078 [Helicobacter pylori Hp H-4]|nr:hypothetical protein HPHPH4_1078 [Helicobacter pylori Hp H-4]
MRKASDEFLMMRSFGLGGFSFWGLKGWRMISKYPLSP